MIGPSGMPIPSPITSNETALPRSAGPKSAARTANATGIMMAAPIPITPRAAITRAAESTPAATAEEIPNTPSPMRSSRLRPYRSPSAPQVSIRPAITRT